MLTRSAPPSVDSSALAERDPQSRYREAWGLFQDRSHSRSSQASLSHDWKSLDGRRRARSRSDGSRARSHESRYRASSRSRSRRSVHSRRVPSGSRLPACDLGSPGRGLRTAPGAVGFAHTLGVTACGLDESARVLLAAAGPAVIVRDCTVPGTGPVTVCGHGTGLSSPLTGLSHGRGVGNLDGVAGIVRRLMVPPRITATLVRRWGLLLRLRAAPLEEE